MTDDAKEREVCGAYVITVIWQGEAVELRYCLRTEGPCHFPGAEVAEFPDGSGRPCAAQSGYDFELFNRQTKTGEKVPR